jgi:hypothetical protein
MEEEILSEEERDRIKINEILEEVGFYVAFFSILFFVLFVFYLVLHFVTRAI